MVQRACGRPNRHKAIVCKVIGKNHTRGTPADQRGVDPDIEGRPSLLQHRPVKRNGIQQINARRSRGIAFWIAQIVKIPIEDTNPGQGDHSWVDAGPIWINRID